MIFKIEIKIDDKNNAPHRVVKRQLEVFLASGHLLAPGFMGPGYMVPLHDSNGNKIGTARMQRSNKK